MNKFLYCFLLNLMSRLFLHPSAPDAKVIMLFVGRVSKN